MTERGVKRQRPRRHSFSTLASLCQGRVTKEQKAEETIFRRNGIKGEGQKKLDTIFFLSSLSTRCMKLMQDDTKLKTTIICIQGSM